MFLDNLIEENKPLAPFTTLGIGGPARWFIEATTEEEIAEAAAWASERGVPLFVLGGGSNLLVSDGGFDGLVLHVGLRGIDAEDAIDGSAKRVFRVAAGEDWDCFVAAERRKRVALVSSAWPEFPERWAALRCRTWARMGRRWPRRLCGCGRSISEIRRGWNLVRRNAGLRIGAAGSTPSTGADTL